MLTPESSAQPGAGVAQRVIEERIIAVIPAFNEERSIGSSDSSIYADTNCALVGSDSLWREDNQFSQPHRALIAGPIVSRHGTKVVPTHILKLMRPRVSTSVVLPAYNEEDALPLVLDALLKTLDRSYEVLVVDDGSTDRTRSVAEGFGVRVLVHQQNQGKGAAMRTGASHALGRKIIFIDADATYPVAMIPALSAKLDEFDLVRGLRVEGRRHMPVINRVGNSLFEMLVRAIHRVDSSDVLTGMYGLRAESLHRMKLTSTGFDIESEIVIKAGTLGLRTSCIPISYHERVGTKKLSSLRDGLKILRRVMALAVLTRPFLTYVLPGILLWMVALTAMLAFARGPLITAWAGFATNTFIAVTMAFLAGFQLIAFGAIANLYASESGLGTPSRSLKTLARNIPRLGGAIFAAVMAIVGALWALLYIAQWILGGFRQFDNTEGLVIALALVVWGVQLLSTLFVLSLFIGTTHSRDTDK